MPLNRVEPNWKPHSSFNMPVVGPSSQPGDSPVVCPPINTAWIPYVLGALQQLAQETTWAASSPLGVLGSMDAAEELLRIVGNAGACGNTWPEQVWICSNGNGIILRVTPACAPYAEGFIVNTNTGLAGVRPVGSGYWSTAPAYPFIKAHDVFGVYTSAEIDSGGPAYGILPMGSTVWCASGTSHGIDIRLASTGGVTSTISGLGLAGPIYMATDINGRVWVTNGGSSHSIVVLNASGTLFGSYTPAGSPVCYNVARVDYGGNSYMWVTDVSLGHIYELTPGLTLHNTFTPAFGSGPAGIAQINGNVWVGTASTVYILSTAGVILSSHGLAGLNEAVDILHIPAGP